MRNRANKFIVAGCFALLLGLGASSNARAGGFLVYDVSGEALGKASAVTASVNEPAAVFFNPAALSHMEGYQFSLGTVYVRANAEFEDAATGERTKAIPRNPGFFLPTIYGMARINDWVAVGLGVYTIFGLGTEWPHDWIGREHSILAEIETVTFSPTVSIRINKKFSFGVGLNVVRGVVDMTNGLPEAIGGTVQIGGATFGFGAHAALLYRPIPNKLHFGVTYHSRVKLSFDGRADFEPEHEEFVPSLQDQGGKAEIVLPDIISLGVMYRPIKQLTITFDTNVVLWSTYDELVLDFELRESQTLMRGYKNVATFRLGFEYALPVKGLKARWGFIYDMNPAPEKYMTPSLPDANRIDFALGLGYERGWLKLDLGYLFVYMLKSDAVGGAESPEGTYRSIAHLLAFTFTARFGKGAKKDCDCGKDHSKGTHLAPPVDDPRAASPADRPATRSVSPAPPVKTRPRATPPTKRPAGATNAPPKADGVKNPAPARPATNP